MENSFWYRYFLVINKLSNLVLGHKFQNFALLIFEEQHGRYGNEQMTIFFTNLDQGYSDLMSNDPLIVFDELDLDELAEISVEQLEKDYMSYCEGKLKFDFRDND